MPATDRRAPQNGSHPHSTLEPLYREVLRRNPGDVEFHQAVHEVLESLGPVFARRPELRDARVIERLCEPERQIIFRVPWHDDAGRVHINRGFRVEFNSALGPYKGGLRFHPSVNLGIVKFLGFEQIFKNALTGLPHRRRQGRQRLRPQGPLGRRGHALLPVLHDRALPAHRRAHRRAGRRHRRRRPRDRLPVRPVQADHQPLRVRRADRQGPGLGRLPGPHARPPATASCSSPTEMLRTRGRGPRRAARRGLRLGQRRDLRDREGPAARRHRRRLLRLRRLRRRREGHRPRAAASRSRRSSAAGSPSTPSAAAGSARFVAGGSVWDVAVRRGAAVRHAERARPEPTPTPSYATAVKAVAEGANMPTHARGRAASSTTAGVAFGPGKAANAGGVATSALEMQQNASRDSWSFEHTEERLAEIMRDIHDALPRDRGALRAAGQLRGRREHRRLRAGRGRDARAGRHLTPATRETSETSAARVTSETRESRSDQSNPADPSDPSDQM